MALNEAGCWLAYEGEWVRGHKTGRGTVHSLSGETYTGVWRRAAAAAQVHSLLLCCACTCPMGQYQGSAFKAGKAPLSCLPPTPTGLPAAGQLVDGMRQGQGRMQYCNGDVYEGGWEAGARAGQGRLTAAATGDVFVGRWVHDSREGPGSLYMVRTVACCGRGLGCVWLG